MSFGPSGFSGMFSVIWIFFIVIFVISIGFMIFVFGHLLRQKRKNDKSPRLTVPATVVAKTSKNSAHHTGHAGSVHHHHHYTTTYYVTFQVESGDRMELHMTGSEYGLLIEGDKGKLTFQGTRYLGFERSI